ncbi:MAG: FHA domain-containing protein [Planctomycetota bacterium]|nr:FHA domain-containing protein [Planctomycetota bacterium]
MATLHVASGPGEGRIYAVGDETTTIGRDAACGVRLEDSQVSRLHAEIRREGPDRYFIRDLGSSNGTRLNGIRIAQWIKLRDGDEISLGQTLLRFSLRGATPAAAEEESTPPETVIQTLETQELPYLREDADEALKHEHLERLRFLLRLGQLPAVR